MNKKLFIIIVSCLIIIIGIVGALLLINNNSNEEGQQNEIQPQEETTDEQMRNTIITLYFLNKETNKLMPEGRNIDSKKLLTDPYATLLNLLIEEPKNDKLKSAIPQGTRVLKTELKDDMIYVDLSKEFIDNHEGGIEAENNTIYAIVNTLTELNEVNCVKILINGRENEGFKDGKIKFKDAFVRIQKESNSKKVNN